MTIRASRSSTASKTKTSSGVASKHQPRFPVYVPSKGRVGVGLTVKLLLEDEVPFKLVVTPDERDAYKDAYPTADLLVLPANDLRLLGTRLWIRQHSIDAGFSRHWQIDDNISGVYRRYRGKRVYCGFGVALRAVEDFTERYTNIGVSGMNYRTFAVDNADIPPFYLNCHVYSCSLINNEMPYKWRLYYNDDTDLCLQVLAGGMCTVAFNAFLVDKKKTMTVRGGNTDDLYRGDGRLRMSRDLEQQWPGVVETRRKFGRPQHHIKHSWSRFDTPLERRTDIDWSEIEGTTNDYGMRVVAVADEVKSDRLRAWVEESEAESR